MLKRALTSVRTNLITGFLTLVPIWAALWVASWMWDILSGMVDVIPQSIDPVTALGIQNSALAALVNAAVSILMLALILAFVWATGLISRYYLGRKLLDSIKGFVSKVPVLRTVYTTLEQLVQTFASSHSRSFRRVVMVEYPRKGLFTLALVTGEREEHPTTGVNEKFLTVYVPTTPNPTSGFYLIVSAAEVKEVDMTVEQALKEIISLGIVHRNT